jgi:hypothetical protein
MFEEMSPFYRMTSSGSLPELLFGPSFLISSQIWTKKVQAIIPSK